ncbi:inverse autotransporter beta domain-containing protein [Thalassospira lucentensis]|uniref:inverse autotransporter beta domain-containing protein n=1 Tax=Thalassospira lucentensis TaxID=168935 RepID=UPI00142D286D|nr:inverse autotransporter beta domain-containing protein [Thalassospira lucentensis]NIZ02528.1 hypothetical protein [Thalassospira lucentensis]
MRVKKNTLIGLLFASTVLAASGANADTVRTLDKWGPHIDLEGKAGTDRNLGEADLFIPLWQDDNTLSFGSIRARMDDNNSHEGNFGLGIRQMLDTGWNIGGYGYFDRRHSPYGNKFNQLTFGAEALSVDWDFRANAYVPIGTTQYMEDSLSTVDVSGATLMYSQGEERALRGFDAEIGWRIPLFEPDAGQQLRAYAGGYRFTEKKVDTIQGPRGRLDLTFDKVPFLWEGSRFSLGAEIQHDNPRGTKGFASFRLRIPLQNFGDAPKPRLTAMERRMTAPIIRDIDVVSQAGQFSAPTEITQTADGKTITLLNSNAISAADFSTAIANAGTNSTVILNGNYTNVASVTTVQDGQTIVGGGALNIKTPTGRSVTVAIPDAPISGEGQVAGGGASRFFDMADNSSLIGITANLTKGESTAIAKIDGKHNVTIENNDISVVANGSTAQLLSIRGSNNSNIRINDNTVSITGKAGTKKYIVLAGSVVITNLSGGGNTSNITTCSTGMSGYTITGTVTTSGTTCP